MAQLDWWNVLVLRCRAGVTNLFPVKGHLHFYNILQKLLSIRWRFPTPGLGDLNTTKPYGCTNQQEIYASFAWTLLSSTNLPASLHLSSTVSLTRLSCWASLFQSSSCLTTFALSLVGFSSFSLTNWHRQKLNQNSSGMRVFIQRSSHLSHRAHRVFSAACHCPLFFLYSCSPAALWQAVHTR